MKKMQTLLILFIVAVSACKNPEKNKRDGINGKDPSPAETGMHNGREVKLTRQKDTLPRKQPELQVRDVDVQVLGDSTKIGKPGDVVLTFIGQGFVFTDHNPVLRMGKEEISDTYSNEDATELYVVVPAKNMNMLMAGVRSGALSIVNPDKKEVRITEQTEAIMGKMKSGEKVNLIYTTYAVGRKRVR